MLFFPFLIRAQYGCGAERLLSGYSNHSADTPLLQTGNFSPAPHTSPILIPVVFHIIYNTPSQNIHDSLILQQLTRLNEDFQRLNADSVNTPSAFAALAGRMNVQFCLAQRMPDGITPTNGIVRVPTSTVSFQLPSSFAVPDPVKHSNTGGNDAWDTNTYINIWICNLNGATGYSAPPGFFLPADEGIVCHYQYTGNSNNSPYGLGRLIVHEMGHFFSLRHVWGDDGGGCTGTDYVSDTPDQSDYSANCPVFPLTDICSPNWPGVMFMNYMDYSDDQCKNMFSAGQVMVMTNCLTQLRPGLVNSAGCQPPATSIVTHEAEKFLVTVRQQDLFIQSLECKIEQIRIFNASGQVVIQQNQIGKQEISIRTEVLNGLSILLIINEKQETTCIKFVATPSY